MAQTGFRKTMSASTLIGDQVVNAQGENIGKLQEIMLDIETGRIAYGVLDFGGILGMGGKLFAVPWQAFGVDERHRRLTLDVPREKLEQAQGFDPNNWPDTANPEWGRQIFDYYGYTPYWEEL